MRLNFLFHSVGLSLAMLVPAALSFAAGSAHPVTAKATGKSNSSNPGKSGIAWQEGNVDAAFALAKASNKPLFLYWGATWCPPCNQVKATIFNRQDFIERSRFFVPVFIDGDSPGAQKLGTRFKVRGYPSMVLFAPDGTEITRLPGEVDGARYLQVLELGMNAAHPVKKTLQMALTDASKVSANEWRLLSYYSWDTSEQQLVAKDQVASTLLALAQACPVAESAQRLELKAMLAVAEMREEQRPAIARDAIAGRLLAVLADARLTRDNLDILTNAAAELTGLLSDADSPLRGQLQTAWDDALPKLMQDTTLSKADRVSALSSQVALARLNTPKGALDAKLMDYVQRRVAEIDKSTTDVYERQAVISSAAGILTNMDLIEQSDAMLKAELKRSQSPYYYMSSLASNAKKRDDKTGALDWYEQAYQTAKGPATRLQWGASYLTNLLEMAPQDEARIEKAAKGVLTELAATPDAFYERSRRSLERIGKQLMDWNSDGSHQQVFSRVRTQLGGICGKLPANDSQRIACEAILEAPKAS